MRKVWLPSLRQTAPTACAAQALFGQAICRRCSADRMRAMTGAHSADARRRRATRLPPGSRPPARGALVPPSGSKDDARATDGRVRCG